MGSIVCLINGRRKINQQHEGPQPHLKLYQIYEIICKILFVIEQNIFFKVVAVDSRISAFSILDSSMDWQNTWHRLGIQLGKWNQCHIMSKPLTYAMTGMLSFNVMFACLCLCTHRISLNYVNSCLFLYIVDPCNLHPNTYSICPLYFRFSLYL